MTIKINGTNTTAQPSITGTDTDTGLVYGTDEVSIVTGGTEKVKVDSSGDVGVGLTIPASKLHVKGGSLTVEHGSPSTGTGQLNINSESNSQVTFSYDDQGHISFGTATTPATQAGFSEKLRIQSGGGISFNGDTATANALDDYEEGTWTPGINLSSGTNTVHTAWGKYTKIGNIVYLWFRMVFNNTTTASIYELRYLPFVVGGMSSQFPGPSISNFYKINLGSGGTVLGGYWKNGVNEFRFHSCGSNTQQLSPSIGQANTNIEIRGQGYYSVS